MTDNKMSKIASMSYGFGMYLVGLVVEIVVPTPFFGIILAIIAYLFYFKPRGILPGYYMMGYVLLLIVFVAIFGSLITAVIIRSLIGG